MVKTKKLVPLKQRVFEKRGIGILPVIAFSNKTESLFHDSWNCPFRQSLVLLMAGIAFFLAGQGNAIGQEPVDFAHDILPILQSRCAKCHTNEVFKGELSLESRETLLDSGVIEIGSCEDSELYMRIASDDPDRQMPPEGDRLTKSQIEMIGKWIDTGLEWPSEITLKTKKFSRSLELSAVTLSEAKNELTEPIDQLLAEYFQKSSVEYPKPLSDWQFVRRAKMDLLGQLPTPDEIARFVGSQDAGKHQMLIHEFLSRDRDYADHWISFWNDLLRNDYAGTGYIDGGRTQITQWLHRSLIENKPYDQFVRELINPSPESVGFINGIKWRGNVNASQIQPLQFSQNISQVFLGINMKCASCHDSFIDDWKLADAYGLAAITADQPLEMYRCDVPTGETAKSKFVFPSIGQIDDSLSRTQRLAKLAELITSRSNGRFPRTIVNRLWERMMGRGLVHPVDVMAGEAWSETMLDFLALDLVEHGYDLKRTLKSIATSQIYRSQSMTDQAQASGQPFVFHGVYAKRMTAEQLVDAVWQLTGAGPTKMDANIQVDGVEDADIPVRASLVNSDALMRSLGRPNREQVVTTRPAELSTLQALELSNGETLSGWLSRGAEKWIQAKKQNNWTNDQLLSRLFLEALSREPTATEIALMGWDEQQELQQPLEDVLWMIMMLPDFQIVQ